jgi:sigma-B regulation protein RsbU (phosphoserine phosphatase)
MGPGEVGFVLADVAGKGIAAALLMASLQGSLHSQYGTDSKDIPQLLASVNRHFYKHTAKDRYATLFFGRYSDATRTLHYVNCGHKPLPTVVQWPLRFLRGVVHARDGATKIVALAVSYVEAGDAHVFGAALRSWIAHSTCW